MTKEEMIQLINDTFNNLVIAKPLTKQEMIDEINEKFDKLLIKVNG